MLNLAADAGELYFWGLKNRLWKRLWALSSCAVRRAELPVDLAEGLSCPAGSFFRVLTMMSGSVLSGRDLNGSPRPARRSIWDLLTPRDADLPLDAGYGKAPGGPSWPGGPG
jgi:hypothetical protein